MSRLADVQRAVRDAVVLGETGAARPLLVGGIDPAERLAIHHRHYRASLVGTLLTRFPALSWLLGSTLVQEAAEAHTRLHPPQAPCLAEYGAGFPAFLARRLDPARFPYVQSFGELEWHVGAVSIAVEVRAVDVRSLPQDALSLAAASLALQPGLRYLRADWPVDDLLKRYLSDTAPDAYELKPADRWIEVRGGRGRFEINAIAPGAWVFRSGLQRGDTVVTAADRALAVVAAFDPGAALVALLRDGLVARIDTPKEWILR
jgi:hypothetical protein